MWPWLTVGSLRLPTYNLAILFAIVIAGYLGLTRLLRHGGPASRVLLVFWPTVLVGLLGAFAWPRLTAWIGTLLSLPAGLPHKSSLIGAIVAGGATGLLACRIERLSIGRTFDLGGAIPFPLGQAIGRLGCLAAGCCGGRPTDEPFGLYLSDAAGVWCTRWPTQLMATSVDLGLFAGLLALERARTLRPGTLSLLYLLGYCLKRLVLEFARADAAPAILAGLNGTQWLCACAALLWCGLLIWRACRRTPSTVSEYPTLGCDVDLTSWRNGDI
jgi:phosphatidylglycerol---prolipoprotein diacylglyceryl transferase